MKPLLRLPVLYSRFSVTAAIAAVALSLSAHCNAADTVTSPVGEYHVPVAPGTTVWIYGLVREEVWSGTLEEVVAVTGTGSTAATQLRVAGGPFVPAGSPDAATAFTAAPHYLEVLEGAGPDRRPDWHDLKD